MGRHQADREQDHVDRELDQALADDVFAADHHLAVGLVDAGRAAADDEGALGLDAVGELLVALSEGAHVDVELVALRRRAASR